MAKWVDDFAKAEQLKQATTDALEQKERAASLTIRAEAPEYWRQLVMELKHAASELSQKANLRIRAEASEHSEPHEYRARVRVTLIGTGTAPKVTYTDVFHRVGQSFIQCHTSEATAFKLHFAVRGDGSGIGVYAEDGNGVILGPEQAAQHIVEPMAKQVCGTN